MEVARKSSETNLRAQDICSQKPESRKGCGHLWRREVAHLTSCNHQSTLHLFLPPSRASLVVTMVIIVIIVMIVMIVTKVIIVIIVLPILGHHSQRSGPLIMLAKRDPGARG